jgi:hypothetical protein
MTTPVTPEPGGFLGKVRAWFERDVKPGLDAVETDVENLKKLAPALLQVAQTVEALVKSADPAAASEIAALLPVAEKAAAVIEEIVAELAASGV